MDVTDTTQLHGDRVIIPENRARITIPRVADMDPFLMTLVSSTDLWMFLTSNGGLTAGRVDAAGAIFPYETVDRLYERPGRGGSVTYVRAESGPVWQPLGSVADAPRPDRGLTKSALGDEAVFEETSPDGGLIHKLRYRPSDRFGWVRETELGNLGEASRDLDVLDGLLDVLPAGVDTTSQQRASNLVDAYRHTELDPARRDFALYGLASLLTDRAEPAEALRVNAVWRIGPEGTVHLGPRTVRRWLRGEPMPPSRHLRGEKGAYLFHHRVTLAPGETIRWRIVFDARLDHRAVAELSATIARADVEERLLEDLDSSRRSLIELARSVDGFQRSRNPAVDLNHLSNALFNGLRGGFLVGGGPIPREEVSEVLELRNREVARRHRGWLLALPESLSPEELRTASRTVGAPDLERLTDEVVPLAFGRRHGDPSRPWNRFSIRVRDGHGRPRLAYEGNWRDIFQNWEALATSYPDYLPSFIAKFVNASTVDGFNPYRISKEGVDWEVPDPSDPWSNIGYWGDHQVIYLLRLLEALERYRPSLLAEMLDARRFSFADVPYRLVDFDAMLADPASTIDYDEDRARAVADRVARLGTDGRLVFGEDGVAHTHLWEKLLITLAAKLSSLVVDGGIWMNTQRPEWNDANNALPGRGLSVVTLAHTLRFSRFLHRLAQGRAESVGLSADVHRWLETLGATLSKVARGAGAMSPEQRRAALEDWGRAFSRYRSRVYEGWTSERADLSSVRLTQLLADAESVLARSLLANRRPDGLFHAYNTVDLGAGGAVVRHLPLMLEGQVAALDAQVLSPTEAASLVDALFASPLYRTDQNSFLLYPDQTLPDFEARNQIPEADALELACVRRWLVGGDRRILSRDAGGVLRFDARFRNAQTLAESLDDMVRRDELGLEPEEREGLLELYEQTFGHRSFTGRSQGMYGFEGLGCIYWHMVAKLLLAVGEALDLADGEEARVLLARYRRVRAGLNFNKLPGEYGAFPTDAYSHTPGHSGAQQPGMTGQVKEQILTRLGELGVRHRGGRLGFSPRRMDPSERVSAPTIWTLPDESRRVDVPAGGLAFLYAGVPVVMGPTRGQPGIRCIYASGDTRWFPGEELDEPTTRAWLARATDLDRVEVEIGGSTWTP